MYGGLPTHLLIRLDVSVILYEAGGSNDPPYRWLSSRSTVATSAAKLHLARQVRKTFDNYLRRRNDGSASIGSFLRDVEVREIYDDVG